MSNETSKNSNMLIRTIYVILLEYGSEFKGSDKEILMSHDHP
jgi:hypothetical protein